MSQQLLSLTPQLILNTLSASKLNFTVNFQHVNPDIFAFTIQLYAFFFFALSSIWRRIGENTQQIPTIISTHEIGLVKKVEAVPVFWNAFNILLSKVGPKINARINGEVGSPPNAINRPITAKNNIIPHLYKLLESTYALTNEMINSAGYI